MEFPEKQSWYQWIGYKQGKLWKSFKWLYSTVSYGKDCV